MNKLVMKRKAKKAADYFFTYLLLIVIAIICAGPFIWLLLSSLRTGANIYNLHFSISDFSFSNYTGVMEYMNLPKYIWNTVIITFGGIIIDVVFSSLCAYPLATMEFKGKNIIFTILVGTMIIPAAGTSWAGCNRCHLKPWMILQQRDKSLSYHTCSTKNTYF